MGQTPDDGEEALTLLGEVENVFRRMIGGVFRFLFVHLPGWVRDLLRDIFGWVRRVAWYAARFVVRLARVGFFAATWSLLVFGPAGAAFYFAALDTSVYKLVGASWAVVGLVGSVWGLRRWWQQRAARRWAYDPDDGAWEYDAETS